MDHDEPMLTQCPEHESGGVQCEAWLTQPDEPHGHYISERTMRRLLRRPFFVRIGVGE